MTVRANKPAFNIREKLKELTQSIGLKGRELMRAATAQEARDLVSAGRRNLIINGKFEISQRGTTFTYSGTAQDHTVYNSDRFTTQTFGSSFPSGNYLQITQDTDVPTSEFKNSQKIEVLQDISWGSGPNGVWTRQTIEGNNISHLGFGGSNPSTITLSFWVKATKSGTFTATIKDSTSSVYYMCPVTIASANTWQYVTKTIPGATTGTWNTDNTEGLQVFLTWGIHSGWIAGTTTNQWASGNISGTTTQTNFLTTDGDIVWITGVQLEVGKNATEFEHRSYGEELALCMRYYQKYTFNSASYQRISAVTIPGTSTSTNAYGFLTLKERLRAAPTTSDITFSDANTFRMNGGGASDQTASTISSSTNGIGIDVISFDVTFGTARTSGRSGWISAEATPQAVIEVDVEL